jgi:hypothetical protein
MLNNSMYLSIHRVNIVDYLLPLLLPPTSIADIGAAIDSSRHIIVEAFANGSIG